MTHTPPEPSTIMVRMLLLLLNFFLMHSSRIRRTASKATTSAAASQDMLSACRSNCLIANSVKHNQRSTASEGLLLHNVSHWASTTEMTVNNRKTFFEFLSLVRKVPNQTTMRHNVVKWLYLHWLVSPQGPAAVVADSGGQYGRPMCRQRSIPVA